MKQVIAFIQPRRLGAVVHALHQVPGLSGMGAGEVRGFGRTRRRDARERTPWTRWHRRPAPAADGVPGQEDRDSGLVDRACGHAVDALVERLLPLANAQPAAERASLREVPCVATICGWRPLSRGTIL